MLFMFLLILSSFIILFALFYFFSYPPISSSFSNNPKKSNFPIKNAVIFYNNSAGEHISKSILTDTLIPLLEYYSISIVAIYESKQSKYFTELLSRIEYSILDSNVFIVLGGDGTLQELLQGYYNLLNNPKSNTDTLLPPILLLPCGTGNSFCTDLKIYNTSIALDTLISNKNIGENINSHNNASIRDCDVLLLSDNKQYISANVIAVGLVSNISSESEIMRYLGYFRYIVSVVINILFKSLDKSSIEYIISYWDENMKKQVIKEEKFITLFFQNTQYFGTLMRASPLSKIDDGFLNIIGGHYNNPAVFHAKSRKVSLYCKNRNQLQGIIDGEQVTLTKNFSVEVLPSFFRVVTPCSK